MAYAVKADIQKRLSDAKLIQLTDFAGTGAMDDAKITQALEDASALIDSRCRGRYVLPLTASGQVKKLCVDLAIYQLHAGRQAMNDQVAKDYEESVGLLKEVARGLASLDQATAAQATELDVKKPARAEQGDTLRFSKGNLEGF